MATGIPVNGKKPEPDLLRMALEYEGKEPTESIISSGYRKSVRAYTNDEGSPNLLFFDDNLNALRQMATDPAIRGKVALAYIDPPFSTGGLFECKDGSAGYQDTLSGSEYIEFIRKRLVLIHELLSDKGSLYVHLDANMVFHVKVILDEIFGSENFRNMITRKKCSNKNFTRKSYGDVCDYILFYTKTSDYVWNRPYETWTDEKILKEYPCVDGDGRRYKKVAVHAPGKRNGETGKEWKGMLPPEGKHWQYVPSKLDEMDAKGEIYWSPTGNPRRKVYLDSSKGIPMQNIWTDCRDSVNQNDYVTGYPTEKNIQLLKRIVSASSNPGDIVLDCFSGSGATLDAAQQLGRVWIGVDQGDEAIRSTLKRFTQGLERSGNHNGPMKCRQQKLMPGSDCGFTVFCSPDAHDSLMGILSDLGLQPAMPMTAFDAAENRCGKQTS